MSFTQREIAGIRYSATALDVAALVGQGTARGMSHISTGVSIHYRDVRIPFVSGAMHPNQITGNTGERCRLREISALEIFL